MREGRKSGFTRSPLLPVAENHVGAQVGDQPGCETSSNSPSRLASLSGTAHAVPEKRHTASLGARLTKEQKTARESHTSAQLSCTPTRCPRCKSATGPPGRARAVAPFFCFSHCRTTSEPSSRRGTLAGTRAVRRKTVNSPALQGECVSPLRTASLRLALQDHIKTRAVHLHTGQPAQAERPVVARTGGTSQRLSCFKVESHDQLQCAVVNDLVQTSGAATAEFSQIDPGHAAQPHLLRMEGNSVRTWDTAARQAMGRQSERNTMASTAQLSRLTRHTGSLTPTLSMRKSLSTAALLSSRRKTTGAAQGGAAAYLADPTRYSRLPPEVWVYKGPDCSAEGSSNAEGEEHSHKRPTLDAHRGTVAGHSNSRSSVEAGLPASQSKRSSPLAEKRLVFPLEKPDGHQQADFLCCCIPTLLELNNVPRLFSLKQCLVAVEPAVSAFPQQARGSVNCLHDAGTPVAATPAERPAAPHTSMVVTENSRGARKVTVSEEAAGTRTKANVCTEASPKERSNAHDIPFSDRLSRGLQAAHEARVLSEWWGGLMNVVDVTLFELCRQLKTFAPYHAKCLEVLHQLLVDYTDVHQQTQAKQVAQIHASLLEAHAEHAALRKEIASLDHKMDKLQSKAQEAGELRRLLDIQAHLFSLQEIEVLTAQQVEEDALQADFQWHKLLEVVEALKFGKDSTSMTDVWVSGCDEERQKFGRTEHAQQLLSAVLPTVVTLLPHETIVKGILESSAHARLFQIRIPPGRWNLAVAVTCSQPLDISLLLLLASKHTIHEDSKEQENSANRDVVLQEKEDRGQNSSTGLRTFCPPHYDALRSSTYQVPSLPALSAPPHKSCPVDQSETSYLPTEATDVPNFSTGALQIGSFASFRISPGEPQILQVRMPASGSPHGGWLLMRLQGTLCAKSCFEHKSAKAQRNSLAVSARNSSRQGMTSGSRGSLQPLRARFLTSLADVEGETQSLHAVKTTDKLAHVPQDSDATTSPNKLEKNHNNKLGSDERADGKRDNSLSGDHESVFSAAASGANEVRFSLTVHSVFLHRSVEKREQPGPSDDSEHVVDAHTHAFQLQHLGVRDKDSCFSTVNNMTVPLAASASPSSVTRPDVSRPACNRLRCQFSWPPRLVLKREANTQTVTSKLFRGFVRRLHENPRRPPVPQFCVCKSEILDVGSPHQEKKSCHESQPHTGTESATGGPPCSQPDLELTATYVRAASNHSKALTQQTASLSAGPAPTPSGEAPLNAARVHDVEVARVTSKDSLNGRKYPYYYAPAFPIMKLLLDETPVALGDFTDLIHQNHILRDAAGVPVPFKCSDFVRWPPRLVAETIWIILLQHTRARLHTRGLTPAQEHKQQPPTGLHRKWSPPASAMPLEAPGSLNGASTLACTHAVGAELQRNTARKPDVPGLLESDRRCDESFVNPAALDSSASETERMQNSIEPRCASNAHSLAASTFDYFLSRFNVALIAHSVLQSFLLSILYWAPMFEAIAQPPQQSDGIVSLHQPLLCSGSITTDNMAENASSSDFSEDVEGKKQPVETVRDREVKKVTSTARGFTPWFAARLFGRVTGLLSSSRDTRLFRRSLNDFVCLVVEAFLDELTLFPSLEKQRGRSSSTTVVADELKSGPKSCSGKPPRLPSDGCVAGRSDSVGSQSFHESGRLSLPFIPPSHLRVPSELCLAVTHRAAARIGVRIFNEEGTSEYRAAVFEAINLSKEAALASTRLPRRLLRWTHTDTFRPSLAVQRDISNRCTFQGSTIGLHPATNRENPSFTGERSHVLMGRSGSGDLRTCGPSGNGDPLVCRGSFHSSDTSWDLPMSLDLLLQILTQQWEVLYVHLQQAMELLLDQTDEGFLKPLSSLSDFSSFARRLNPNASWTPQEVLHLYGDSLSGTSSRLQSFCSSLPSTALSAVLLHRSRLLDFRLPLPPSPFLTLAPYVDVAETSAAPRPEYTSTRLLTKKNALPLWPIHTHCALPFTTAESDNPSRTADENRAGSPSAVATIADPTLSIISSASHEFRLAAFIVKGLITFMRAHLEICDEDAFEVPHQCADKSMTAWIACHASLSESKMFGKDVTVLSPRRKGVQEKRAGTEVPSRCGIEGLTAGDSVSVASQRECVRKPPFINMCGTGAVVVSRLRKESATDAHEAGCVSQDVLTGKGLLPRQKEQANADSSSPMSGTRIADVFNSKGGGQRRLKEQSLQVAVQQGSPEGYGSTSQAVVTGGVVSHRYHIENVDSGSPLTKVDGISTSTTVCQDHSPSNATVNHSPFHHQSRKDTRKKIFHGAPASGPTRRLSPRTSLTYIDILLDRRAALETAKDIESAAATEGALAGSVLRRLESLLKALLLVYGRTDLPEVLTDEPPVEPQDDFSVLVTQGNVTRSLEGFTPSRGLLSPRRQTDEEEKQTLSSSDLTTAQVLLLSIWNTIFMVSSRIAEECERRKTFEHVFALQRIQCRAAAKEALRELARIYRDQIDRLLILSLGSEGASAIMEQPELRAKLLRMHQSMVDVEQQQLRLQEVLSSAAGAAPAGKVQQSDEEGSEEAVKSVSERKLDVEVPAVNAEGKHKQLSAKERNWKSYSGGPIALKRANFTEGRVQRQNKSVI